MPLPAAEEEAAATVWADVPGMAASASSDCRSACWVAAAGAFFGLLAAAFGCWAEDACSLLASVVAAGRSPLLTKPWTPCEPSEPEYSWVLTEKLGRESPPMVESTPPENPVITSTWLSNTTQSPGSGS